ncbi:MAG: DNA polymerase IV [Planctomycetes bacterium]|nr:DNA polymerase IV [Planctomycetota bacterium]
MPLSRDQHLPRGTRRILHLDVDAFLASVEQALHPELGGKPVVVGGQPTSRNLVMSCSYEARAFGVRAGMHLSEARRRCPRAIFRDGDSQAANRLRDEVTRTLLGFTPTVEVASIDDFYLDLTGTERLLGAAFDAAWAIQRAVQSRTQLGLSIGVGTNRLVARLAGKLGKPGGVAEILPGGELAFVGALPLEHLPGVGHATGALLERFALHYVRELRLVSREVLFAAFGSAGLLLFERAHGRDETPIEATHVLGEDGTLHARPPHSLQRETTFEPEEGRPEVIEAMLSYLVERGAQRLRAQGVVARALEVRARWVDTNPRPGAWSAEGLGAHRRRALSAPSDATHELYRLALELYRSFPKRRALLKRIGVAFHGLSVAPGWQGQLFSGEDAAAPSEHDASRADRHRRLDRALDELREKHGFGRILRGTSTPLAASHPLEADGFKLRTPSLNQ